MHIYTQWGLYQLNCHQVAAYYVHDNAVEQFASLTVHFFPCSEEKERVKAVTKEKQALSDTLEEQKKQKEWVTLCLHYCMCVPPPAVAIVPLIEQ